MEFYKYKYTLSKKRKRIYIFINAIQILSPEFKFNTDMLEKYPIYEKYHLIVQACANINIIYKEKKKDENLENDIINSRIKQDTTYCVTKFSDINLINDREPKTPRYKRDKDLKALEMEKKKLEKKLKDEKKMLKIEEKFSLLNMIDNSILQDTNRVVHTKPIKKTETYEIQRHQGLNKTINLLDEIDRKIKNKGKTINSKTKDVFVFKKD